MPSGSTVIADGTVGEPMYFQATFKNTKGEPVEGVKAEMVSSSGIAIELKKYQ